VEVAGLCETLADQTTRHHNPYSIAKRHHDSELVLRGKRQQDPIKGSAVATVIFAEYLYTN
jgi:hypothetical protein